LIALVFALLVGAPTTPGLTQVPPPQPPAAAAHKPETVIEPELINAPSQTLLLNCTTGYLTDPTFTGESIVLGCVVQKDGSLDACQVKETKRAQAAGVQDVAICAAAGFRIGAVDKLGKPTAGRPIIIPMAIATLADVANASSTKTAVAPAAPSPTVTTPAQSPSQTKPKPQ
jgi:hypothetical protein